MPISAGHDSAGINNDIKGCKVRSKHFSGKIQFGLPFGYDVQADHGCPPSTFFSHNSERL